ncbi:MAG: hypothetical protein JNM12_15380 [Alphaproteobacteria bacterium]|nr:hypothetical protein [Alphaproteobacteria bacterium]
MNETSASLYLEKLVVEGTRKNYTVRFNEGINVIFGDSDTGKSGILELIDYCLGSTRTSWYPQLEATGKFAHLEVTLNGNTYTFKRNLHRHSERIMVYACGIEGINSHKPRLMWPHYGNDSDREYYSDFLMETLGIPLTRVRQAPTKADSKMVRVSFRDLFKFCYLSQDEVGSASLLDQANFVQAVKNREVFKFIFNLLDIEVTELQTQLSEKQIEKSKLEQKLEVIGDFLRDMNIETLEQIESRRSEFKTLIEDISKEMETINSEMSAKTIDVQQLREMHAANENEYSENIKVIYKIEQALERHIRLRNEYQVDIDKANTSINLPNNFLVSEKTDCPLCSSLVAVSKMISSTTVVIPTKVLKHEISLLKAKKKGIEEVIAETIESKELLEKTQFDCKKKLEKLSIEIDRETKTKISPYVNARDLLVSQKAKHAEALEQLKKTEQILKHKDAIAQEISKLQTTIDGLAAKLKIALAKSPSLVSVLDKLSTELDTYLKNVGIANRINPKVSSKTFLPEIRGQDYSKVSSGGLRTILSIGYLVALQHYATDKNSYLPSVMMIDTVGKYLGITRTLQENEKAQTSADEDEKEGVNDPVKYKNMYKEFERLCDTFKSKGRKFQVILVDNNLPPDLLKSLDTRIIKKYRTDGSGGYDIGFIDDANRDESEIDSISS